METQLEPESEAATKLREAIDAWNDELTRTEGLPGRQMRDVAAAYVDFVVDERLQCPEKKQPPPDQRLRYEFKCDYGNIMADAIVDVMVSRLADIEKQKSVEQPSGSLAGSTAQVKANAQSLLNGIEK